jgi:hypothetical protein
MVNRDETKEVSVHAELLMKPSGQLRNPGSTAACKNGTCWCRFHDLECQIGL